MRVLSQHQLTLDWRVRVVDEGTFMKLSEYERRLR
jgi:hypothetical protein